MEDNLAIDVADDDALWFVHLDVDALESTCGVQCVLCGERWHVYGIGFSAVGIDELFVLQDELSDGDALFVGHIGNESEADGCGLLEHERDGVVVAER